MNRSILLDVISQITKNLRTVATTSKDDNVIIQIIITE